MDKKILGMVILVMFAGISTAYAINQSLVIPITINVIDPPIVTDTYWVANVTSLTFQDVESGSSTSYIPVRITNNSNETQILSLDSTLPPDSFSLMVFNPDETFYDPMEVGAYDYIDLLISVTVGSHVVAGQTNAYLVLYSS